MYNVFHQLALAFGLIFFCAFGLFFIRNDKVDGSIKKFTEFFKKR